MAILFLQLQFLISSWPSFLIFVINVAVLLGLAGDVVEAHPRVRSSAPW